MVNTAVRSAAGFVQERVSAGGVTGVGALLTHCRGRGMVL